jgi:hypothetical protein
MKIDASSYIIPFVFILTGGILGYFASQMNNPFHQAIITMESSMPLETQLFYDTGKGFNENDSIRKIIYQVNVPVILDFGFSGPNLYGLRFDPSRSPTKIKIHEIIIKYHKEKPFTVPLDSLTASNDIKSLYYNGHAVTVETTESANDPILYLTRIGPAPRLTPIKMIASILIGAVIALGIAFLFVWVYRNGLDSNEFKV